MNIDMVKVYAAFRSGCLGNNILEAYFPFLASIICNEDWMFVDENRVQLEFERKYKIPVPLTFVRQVLEIGLRNGSIVNSKGQYVVQKDKISKYQFDSELFENKWDKMNDKFKQFCKKNEYSISEYNIDERILESIEIHDESIILNQSLETPEAPDTFDYAWHNFLTNTSEEYPAIFDFIVAISASNIIKQAIFFTGDGRDTFKGLNVYLDSPLVFALLGMDFPERTESYKQLLKKMTEAGCLVQIFDHNYNEVSGILSRAGTWATNPHYSIDLANNAARFFHDSQMDGQSIAEFCESIEDQLSDLEITIKKTSYDLYEDQFQENENYIYTMIEEKYHEQGRAISEEVKQSILVDVRSIIMVYRERRGQTATRIQSSRDILLTLNSTIANLSKKYESNQSTNSGHIPACISADIFGAVLWLFSPAELMEYRKKQLLADCYLALRPNKTMLKKYIESLERARSAGDIDEKKYLFMRSHSVVTDALMNVTKGDYARFNDRTYLEVYEEIESLANKKYEDEAIAHKQTQEAMLLLKEKWDNDAKENVELKEVLDKFKSKEDEDFEKKCTLLGWVFTILIFGLPYLFSIAVVQVLISIFSQFNFFSLIRVGLLILLSIIVLFLFQRGKAFCFKIAKGYLKKRRYNHELRVNYKKN